MLFEAGRNTAELFEIAEEPFHEVALAIEIGRNTALDAHPALCRDVRFAAAVAHQLDQSAAVITSVGYDGAGRQGVEEERCSGLVGGLSGCDQQPDRQAILIDDGVDLGAQSATGTADGVIRPPLFPPAACWWARTMELSIRWRECGDRRASSSNILNQIPRLAQRLKRL